MALMRSSAESPTNSENWSEALEVAFALGVVGLVGLGVGDGAELGWLGFALAVRASSSRLFLCPVIISSMIFTTSSALACLSGKTSLAVRGAASMSILSMTDRISAKFAGWVTRISWLVLSSTVMFVLP